MYLLPGRVLAMGGISDSEHNRISRKMFPARRPFQLETRGALRLRIKMGTRKDVQADFGSLPLYRYFS
jgi:hypothetical protein